LYIVIDIRNSVQEIIDDVSKDDNVFINRHKLRPRSRSACRYTDEIFENSALLAASSTKAASNDVKLNINGATPEKKIKLHKISSIVAPCLIVDKNRSLSLDVEECFLNNSCSLNIEKTINGITLNVQNKIPSDSVLKSNLFDMDEINDISRYSSSRRSYNNFDKNIPFQTDLTFAPSNRESLNLTQYDEFNEHDLIFSKLDASIPL